MTARTHLKQLLFIALALLAAWPAPVGRAADVPRLPKTFHKVWLAEQLDYKGTVKSYPEDEQRRIGRLFKLAEDDDAAAREDLGLEVKTAADREPRKTLQMQLDRKRVREEDFQLFNTEALALPVGTWRVTVRMKFIGMLGVLGTPIWVKVNGTSRRVEWRGYQFQDQEEYQKFTFTFDVIEPDLATGRPTLYGATSPFGGSPGRWIQREPALAAMRRHLRGEYTPEEIKERKEKLRRMGTPRVSLAMGFGKTRRVVTGAEDTPDNTIHSVTVDYIKLEPEPMPAVEAREVLVLKRWMIPGQSQLFRVWLANRGGKKEPVTLNLYLERGLDDRRKIDTREVTLDKGRYRTESIAWKSAPDQPLWGYAVVAEVVKDGRIISSARDVFTVQTDNFAVKILGGAGTPNYANHVEVFGCTPGDCARIILDDVEEPYKTGMSGYVTTAHAQRAACQWNDEVGVGTFMYLFPGYTENHGARLYIKHPEWFVGRLNYSDEAYRVNDTAHKIIRETYAKTRREPDMKELKTFHLEGPLSFHDPKLADQVTDQMIKVMKYIGYTGIRWDGGPMPVYTRNVLGERLVANRQEAMELSAKQFARMKQRIKDAGFPYFINGYNGDTFGYTNIIHSLTAEQKPPREFPQFVEMMKGGGLLMDESFAGAVGYRDPANIIHNYYRAHCQMVAACRSVGGHMEGFPPNWRGKGLLTGTDIYWHVLTVAAGAHIPAQYPPLPWSDDGLAHFVTRYCEFVWDNQLRPLRDAEKKIRVEAPHALWYNEGAVYRELPDRCRWVISIVNPPPVERFLKFRFGELPEPILDPFEMRLQRPAGYKGAVRAVMLTCEPRTDAVKLRPTADGDEVKMAIPELKLFRVIVVEFMK